MKRIRTVAVVYEDGTDEIFFGTGMLHNINTTRKVEIGGGVILTEPSHHIQLNLEIKP